VNSKKLIKLHGWKQKLGSLLSENELTKTINRFLINKATGSMLWSDYLLMHISFQLSSENKAYEVFQQLTN
jgi:hypothetical protein